MAKAAPQAGSPVPNREGVETEVHVWHWRSDRFVNLQNVIAQVSS
jgi:hypothetical protein